MMLQKGIWWTDKATEPQLTTPQFKEAVETWFKFKDYWSEIDWANNAAMMKKGQIMAQFIPDWFFGIYKQGLKDDVEWGKTSPLRVMHIPQFTTDTAATGSWGGTAVSVPKLSQIKDLAMNVLCTPTSKTARSSSSSALPIPAFYRRSRPPGPATCYKQPEGFLGGQVAGTVYVEAAGRLPSYSENWKTSLVATAWGEQAALVWGGTSTIENAIAEADKIAKEKYRQERVRVCFRQVMSGVSLYLHQDAPECFRVNQVKDPRRNWLNTSYNKKDKPLIQIQPEVNPWQSNR